MKRALNYAHLTLAVVSGYGCIAFATRRALLNDWKAAAVFVALHMLNLWTIRGVWRELYPPPKRVKLNAFVNGSLDRCVCGSYWFDDKECCTSCELPRAVTVVKP